MILRKSMLKRVGWVVLVMLLTAGLWVGMTFADDGPHDFTFQTSPIFEDLEFYIETNGNGVHDPEEFIGVFDVYDGNHDITFSWVPWDFPADVNGSYRISLWQNTNPLGETVWEEKKVAHHWANNPNGTTFSMGSFGFGEEICTTCPSEIVIAPEAYSLVAGPNGNTYEYTVLIAEHYSHANGNIGIPESEKFLIQIFRPEKKVCEPEPGVFDCTCEFINQEIVLYCENSCGEEAYPEGPIACID